MSCEPRSQRRCCKPRCWLALILCGVLAHGLLHAHPQFALSTVNRYGTLALPASGSGRLLYTFMIGDVPAHTLRRQADRNGDGQLDAAEQQALARQLLAAMSELKVQLDGKELPLRFEAPHLALSDPRVSPIAFAVELTAPLPFDATEGKPEHLLHYDDRVSLGPIGDVEVRIDEGPGVRVLKTWEGATEPAIAATAKVTENPPAKVAEKATGPQLLFLAQGPPRSSLSDRSVSVRFTRQVGAGASRVKGGGCAGGGRW